MPGGSVRTVPHILKDGADSVGVAGATILVYINEGLYHQEWLECHNPLCQRGGVDLYHTLREMVATRRAELENVKMCRGIEAGGSRAAPRHCLNRFAFRISLAYEAEGHQ